MKVYDVFYQLPGEKKRLWMSGAYKAIADDVVKRLKKDLFFKDKGATFSIVEREQ